MQSSEVDKTVGGEDTWDGPDMSSIHLQQTVSKTKGKINAYSYNLHPLG